MRPQRRMNFIRERYAKKWLVDIVASIHDRARAVLRGRQALTGALGDPVGLVIARGVRARLVVRVDPQSVGVVVTRDPYAGGVALGHPGVCPVAGHHTAGWSGDVHRLRDDDHRQRTREDIRLLPRVGLRLPGIGILQSGVGVLQSRVGILQPGIGGLWPRVVAAADDRDLHACRTRAGRNTGIPAARTASNRTAAVFMPIPLTPLDGSTRPGDSPFTPDILPLPRGDASPRDDAGLDSGPHQLGPARIA